MSAAPLHGTEITIYCPVGLVFVEGFRRFAQRMANSLAVGRFRYGLPQPNPLQDYVRRLKQAIEDYERTGSTDKLVDAGAFACLEHQVPSHPEANDHVEDSGGRRVTLPELAG